MELVFTVYLFMSLLVQASESTKTKRICVFNNNQVRLLNNTVSSYYVTTSFNATTCSYTTTSIENAISNLTSDSTITFYTDFVILDQVLTIIDKENILIQGKEKYTSINCSHFQAGIEFIRITNLTLKNLAFYSCSGKAYSNILYSSSCIPTFIRSGMLIHNSSNIEIEYLNISSSNGTGLAIVNTQGIIQLHKCNFSNNTGNRDDSEAMKSGGLLIQLAETTTASYYSISSCSFEGNDASLPIKKFKNILIFSKDYRNMCDVGVGGGFAVILLDNANNIQIQISECTFSDNTAQKGGGLFVLLFSDTTNKSNNTVTVNNVRFENNHGVKGGGGAYLESIFPRQQQQVNNTIKFKDCRFFNNNAKLYGGGTALKSSQSLYVPEMNMDNRYSFSECNWTSNYARYGSAIDINKNPLEMLFFSHIPTPMFANCIFDSNHAHRHYDPSHKKYRSGIGILMLTSFSISIRGFIIFRNNEGSAVYLASSALQFYSGSYGEFTNNSGFNGGAISSHGFSSIVLNDRTEIIFDGNRAKRRGGAIHYASIDKHDDTSSRSCFFQYDGTEKDPALRNITLTFIGNEAENLGGRQVDRIGNSIYVVNLRPCIYLCLHINRHPTTENVFDCIGNFSFENKSYEVSTSGRFLNGTNEVLKAIPGQVVHINISMTDDLSQPTTGSYYALVEGNNTSYLRIKNSSSIISDNQIRIYGKPDDKGTLTLSKLGFRTVSTNYEVEMVQCPPGYIFNEGNLECQCGDGEWKSISMCDPTFSNAILKRGYWIGYVLKGNESILMEGYCPKYYCYYNKHQKNLHILPNMSNSSILDMSICANRTGRLCGKCREGYSVFYHTSVRTCRQNRLCSVGWLFYFISELFPLTIMFIVVIFFDIRFTSGYATGLIFYAQAFDSLSIHAKDFINFPDGVYELIQINTLIYSFVNFDFFNHQHLSFCIWKRASTLDVLIFKFVTIAYAILLIMITIWLMNVCIVCRHCKFLHVRTVKNSVIHGLSALLVMVYGQCAKISFYILDYTDLFTANIDGTKSIRVVSLDGSMDYLNGSHLAYAIPAIVCILTLILIPPILLILYPLVFKIFHYLGVKESSKFHHLFLNQLTKLKPFLDVFQCDFKDNFRFFSGLYFIYRVTLLTGKFFSGLTELYFFMQSQLITMLFIHALVQPFQKKAHNIINSMLFFNLNIINGLTFYNYRYTREDYYIYGGQIINVIASIQVILISLPPLLVLIYLIYLLVVKCKQKLCNSLLYKIRRKNNDVRSSRERPWSEDEMPARLLGIEDTFNTEYSLSSLKQI